MLSIRKIHQVSLSSEVNCRSSGRRYPNLSDTLAAYLIVLRDDTTRFSAPSGVALSGETALPSQENARVDAEPVTTLPASRDETAEKLQLTNPSDAMGKMDLVLRDVNLHMTIVDRRRLQ